MKLSLIQPLVKSALLIVALLAALPSHASVFLSCRYDNDEEESSQNLHLIVRQVLKMKCTSVRTGYDPDSAVMVSAKAVDTYDVSIKGWGPGLFGGFVGVPQIYCPSVRKAALGVKEFTDKRGNQRKGTRAFVGVNANAGLLATAQGAAFANGKGGVCFLLGVGGGGGASVAGVRMTIEKQAHDRR